MYGGAGGHRDGRAALLATKGFATLALAYLKHQDLPEEITDIRLEYFQVLITSADTEKYGSYRKAHS